MNKKTVVKNEKLLIILLMLILIPIIITSCDTGTDPESTPGEVEIIAELEMTRYDEIFLMNQYESTFSIETLNEGILIFTTDKGKTYPESIEFSRGEGEIKRLFTAEEASRLFVTIKDTTGERVKETAFEF